MVHRGPLRLLTAATVVVCLGSSRLAAADPIPTQWIARQYTELLGRAPTSNEWNTAVSNYAGRSCDAASLAILGKTIARSNEFRSKYPESSAKADRIVALERAVYGHDVNLADWNAYYVPYGAGLKSWDQTVDAIYGNGVFGGVVVPVICSTVNASFGVGPNDRLDVRALLQLGSSRTQAQVQAALDVAGPGTTVYLESKEVILVGGASAHRGLRVPAGVTLATRGNPDPRRYASMGRLVPNGRLCPSEPLAETRCAHTSVVQLEPGAKLRAVWVDGRGGDPGSDFKLANVETTGSTSAAKTTVLDNRLTDPAADGVAIRARGYSTSGQPCQAQSIEGNLITGYASSHEPDRLGNALWADGIAVFCEAAAVRSNEIVDVTDTGIMLYGAYNRTHDSDAGQRSIVENNVVLSAGLSAHVALGADPVGECESSPGDPIVPCLDVPGTRSFDGARVKNNMFWTGPRTHFDIGLMIGGKPLWGDHGSFGTGASFTNNTVGAPGTRVNMGVSVMGMYQTTLTGNAASYQGNAAAYQLISTNPANDFTCPTVGVGVGNGWVASVRPGSQAYTNHDSSWGCLMPHQARGGPERIAVASDGSRFVGAESAQPFVPWGLRLNLDHKLVEDVWVNNRFEVVSDFREIKRMGANALRLLLQLNAFVDAPSGGNPDGTPDVLALAHLEEIVDLAEQTGLYLDVTGSGIQHAADQPAWYVNATEQQRWAAQRVFWRSVASVLRDRAIVMSYDLMNEPLVPQGPVVDWCQGAFPPSECWIEAITRTPGTRPRVDVARAWIRTMRDAICVDAADTHHLVSVWSLPSTPDPDTGFASADMGDLVDYITVHVYPVADNPATPEDELQRDVDLLQQDYPYPGKPLLIEEFIGYDPQLRQFMTLVKPNVAGWISHYIYGSTPTQNNPPSPVGFHAIELSFDRIFVRDRSTYLAGPGILQP